MTESFRGIFRKRLHTMAACVAVVAMYVTGVLNSLINQKIQASFSVFTAVRAFFCTPATLVLFPLLFCVFGGGCLYILHKSWLDGQLDDKMGRNFRHSSKITPYGDAHMEEPHEYVNIAQIRPVELCKGKVLGQLDEDGGGRECIDFNPFDGRLNQHMIAIGTSGGGKTFTFVKPFMYQARKEGHSLVVSDPKGDLFRETSAYFRDNGYIVRQLNLKDLTKSDGWHMLKTLQGDNLSTNVKIFAQTVISNISKENNIYSSGSNSLLCALLLRVLLGHEYKDEDKNIKTVYQLLQNPAGYEFLEQVFDKNALTKEELPSLAPYMAFKQGSPNLASNIATHLANGLQLFQDELLCDVLSTDDMDLTMLGKQPCIYYCQFPDSHDTYRFIISLFFSMAFTVLLDYADLHTENGKLPVPVDFLLDEFPALGIIPDWDRKMATVRSRGINCVMIIQDIPQLKMRYLESWKTILNNCGTVLTLGINEPDETARWISNRIGETSIEVETEAISKVAGRERHFTSKNSKGVGKRSLLSPDEVCKLSRDGTLILWTGHNPVYAHKTPHTMFADAERHELTLPEDIPPITDIKARKLLRECEDAYRTEFWASRSAHPDLRYSDLSDALYTEEPGTPLEMAWSIFKDDLKALRNLPKTIRARREGAVEPVISVPKEEKPAPQWNALADVGAFKRYREQWIEEYTLGSADKTVSFTVDPNTGELIGDVPEAAEAPLVNFEPFGGTWPTNSQNAPYDENTAAQDDAADNSETMLPIFGKPADTSKPPRQSASDRYEIIEPNLSGEDRMPPAKRKQTSTL